MQKKIKFNNGCVLWEGLSLIDQQPIVLLMTGLSYPSHNTKTGRVLQTYILNQNISPSEAVKNEQDYSICGNCPLRKTTCYVELKGINQVWNKYKRGGYPNIDKDILNRIKRKNEVLRLGSYGDPTAIPFDAWKPLLESVSDWTGYTHQWISCDDVWKDYLMASVESIHGANKAQLMGWRTFRIKLPESEVAPNEILCRHTTNDTITCEDCRLCHGGKGISIVDNVHGNFWKKNNFKKLESELLISQ